MFFFFDFESENGGLTSSLIGDISEKATDLNDVRERLLRETEKQGLRNSDLSELIGWSASKTSKITAGKQKMIADDVRLWARSLGYTPDPFIQNNIDFRIYNLSSYVRSISEVLESYFNNYDNEIVQKAIIQYELPLSILSVLGVNPSEYAIRSQTSYYGINPDSKSGFGGTATYIRFWQRTTRVEGKMTPEFGIWLSPENDNFLFCVYLHRDANDGALHQLRMQYKDALQIDDRDKEEFDQFARTNKEWVPDYVRKGEIFAFCTDTNLLPSPGQIEVDFINLFRKYCSLVWEVKGVDLLPNSLKEREDLSPFQQLDILNGYADFSEIVKQEVKNREKYQCENDASHTSFIDQMGNQYMDVAPIIPFDQGAQYGQVIMSSANGICLCPNCKAQMKYGDNESREDMLIKLYRKHKANLLNNGVNMSLAQVLAANYLV